VDKVRVRARNCHADRDSVSAWMRLRARITYWKLTVTACYILFY